MAQRKDKSIPEKPQKRKKLDSAFDVWLHRSLHTMFDEVANEPLPEDLLRLIEEDRNK
jgi:hypothetical protein